MDTRAPAEQDTLAQSDPGRPASDERFLQEIARIDEKPLPRPDVDLVGTRLGRYRIAGQLGRGGMGVVYLAQDETLHREVALKVLPPNFEEDEQRRGRLLREARAAAAVTHPNIAVVYEAGEENGRLYIAMERAQGNSLRDRLGAGRLPIEQAVSVARQVLQGLCRAHEAGFVHRDLKPDNILIAQDGHVKVLDFGLAKREEQAGTPSALGEAETLTHATATEEGRILGTPGYMSPEQARGDGRLDRRSDIFSFGIVLYEMLAGKRPFSGKTSADILTSILRDTPERLASVDRAIPAQLSRIVQRCLAKEPEGRYNDCQAILKDLDGVAIDHRPGERSNRRRIVWTAALALGIAGLLGGGAIAWRSRSATAPVPPPSASVAPAPIATVVTDLPIPSCPNAEAVAAYRRGLLKLRNGEGIAEMEFRRAVELDPTMAAAFVQLAAWHLVFSGFTDTRDHVRKANEFRSSLTERDQALLDALDPAIRGQPPDWRETARRLSALVERWPGDAQLWLLRAQAHHAFDDEAVLRDAKRALDIDSRYAYAWHSLGRSQHDLGRLAEARHTYERCLEIIPASGQCMTGLQDLASYEGNCKEVETLNRRVIASDPELTGAYERLANALAAQGQPLATVREAKRQWTEAVAKLLPASHRENLEWKAAAVTGPDRHLSILDGDFVSAEKYAREYARLIASSQQQVSHARAARDLSDILTETGNPQEAAAVVLAFLEKRDAWEPPRGGDYATPSLLGVAMRGGKISRTDFAAQREAWLTGAASRIESVEPTARGWLWISGYASTSNDADSAWEALAALPRYEPLPPVLGLSIEATVGRTFLLGGRVDDAIASLRHATQQCSVLWSGIHHTRAHLWLGQALEQKGDRSGACAAYQFVLTRWGKAKPRSVTAEEARARSKTLGCPK